MREVISYRSRPELGAMIHYTSPNSVAGHSWISGSSVEELLDRAYFLGFEISEEIAMQVLQSSSEGKEVLVNADGRHLNYSLGC